MRAVFMYGLVARFGLALNLRYRKLIVFGKSPFMVALGPMRVARIRPAHTRFSHFYPSSLYIVSFSGLLFYTAVLVLVLPRNRGTTLRFLFSCNFIIRLTVLRHNDSSFAFCPYYSSIEPLLCSPKIKKERGTSRPFKAGFMLPSKLPEPEPLFY